MARFKVVDVRKIPSALNNRIGKMDFLVTYQIDALRTSMVTISKDELTEQDIVAAVKADLEQIERYTGKEFEI